MSESTYVEFGSGEAEVVINALYHLRGVKGDRVIWLQTFGECASVIKPYEAEIEIINNALRSMGEKIDGEREETKL